MFIIFLTFHVLQLLLQTDRHTHSLHHTDTFISSSSRRKLRHTVEIAPFFFF